MEVIRQLAGTTWTDHNAHDPGITILEQIAFALSDLGYRLNFKVEDLIAGLGEGPFPGLFSPEEILTTSPVSPADWRKYLFDITGIHNAWAEPESYPSSGLYFNPDSQVIFSGDPRRSEGTPLSAPAANAYPPA